MSGPWNYFLLVILVVAGLLIAITQVPSQNIQNYSSKLKLIPNYVRQAAENMKDDYIGEELEIKKVKMIPGSKWIVVTSIQSPTEDVKKLGSYEDWKLVVVADKKTPTDWNLTNVHFLSMEHQQELFGRFSANLPLNSYTRKNLGYLYAIMNGAEWIYDTDDDNKPHGLGLKQFDYAPEISGLRYVNKSNGTGEQLFNPYRFFGFDNMWPRGFPLEYLEGHTNGRDRMISCRSVPRPAVQQGIVLHDPDVDAIYRLLFADRQTGLNVTFNTVVPPITLEVGTYSPWNSQNTLFHYKAFFILYLPTSVTFRVTDIWRSYFGQKLLHLIGENVAFYPANAIQFRNAHDFLKDFKDEGDVYHQSGKMVTFLDSFNCDESEETKDCVLKLADQFVENKFFGQEDRELIENWLELLTHFGYQFPPLIEGNSSQYFATSLKYDNCRLVNLDVGVQSYHSEKEDESWAADTINGFGEILDWCDESNSTNEMLLPSPERFMKEIHNVTGLMQKNNTVLILLANFPWSSYRRFKTVIGLLQRLYAPFFKTTVFCGTWTVDVTATIEDLPPKEPINFVHITSQEMRGGYAYGYCIPKVRDLRLQNVTGYYFVQDDALFNIWYELPQEKVIIPHPLHPAGQWWKPQLLNMTITLMETKYKDDKEVQKSWKEYQDQIMNLLNVSGYPNTTTFLSYYYKANRKTAADFFYIPSYKLDFFSNLLEVWVETGAMIEFAMGKIVDGMDVVRDLPYKYLWNANSKRRIHEFYNGSMLGVHPWKMGFMSTNRDQRKVFCDNVIKAFGENVYGQYD